MSASPWPGWLVLASLVSVTVGCLLYAVSGGIVLHRALRRRAGGRAVRPARVTWVVERCSPVSGQWSTWGGPYDTKAEALANYTETIAAPSLARTGFRVVAVRTTHEPVAEHLPKDQPAPALHGGEAE